MEIEANEQTKPNCRKKQINQYKKYLLKRGLSNSQADKIILKLFDRTLMDLDLVRYYSELEGSIHPSQRVALLNAGIQLRKAIHGDNLNQTNIQVNIFSEEKIKGMIQRLLNEDNCTAISEDT
ncbi:MAG: hypothetical protein ACOYWZ_13390 [Bacillota bacterium]